MPRKSNTKPATVATVEPVTVEPVTVEPVTVEPREPVAVNKARAAVIARIGRNCVSVEKASAQTLADMLYLSDSIPADVYGDILGREIGGYRVGRAMLRADARTLVKTLRDDARNGGKIDNATVAAVLGISTGQASKLFSESDDESETPKASNPPATVETKLSTMIADFGKLLAKADMSDPIIQGKIAELARLTRQALPQSGTNNTGGQS